MLRIAITGNIASGKSQAEKFISSLGYPVYDSDKIAHEVLNDIKEFYDYDVFTEGKIDRKKLGSLVFSNPDIKKKLENLTHPQIKSKILCIFDMHKSDDFVFVSVPLLYEAGFDDIFDKVLLIKSNSNIQLKRLMSRNNLSEEDALKRIYAQLSQEHKEKYADFIIENNSTIEELQTKINEFITELKQI